ncbi:MAG: flavodoxin domain-containing protein [Verrucomicrobiota bacterium]
MITVLYATETGTAEGVAEEAVNALNDADHETELKDIGDIEVGDLKDMEYAFAVVSTWGEGDPPSDAEDFFEELKNEDPMGLENMRFAVLALGDTAYEDFCQFGKDLEAELQRHGAKKVVDRVDCDLDYEEPSERWIESVVKAMGEIAAPA